MTSNRTVHKQPSKQENKQDSCTEVNTVFRGRRKVVGVRVDETLYKRFKPVAQRVFGSVCRPIEAFMAAILALEKEGVNFGHTIRIEKLVVERNLRPRRYERKPRPPGSRFWSGGRYYQVGEDGEAHETNRYDPEIGWYYDPDYDEEVE